MPHTDLIMPPLGVLLVTLLAKLFDHVPFDVDAGGGQFAKIKKSIKGGVQLLARILHQ